MASRDRVPTRPPWLRRSVLVVVVAVRGVLVAVVDVVGVVAVLDAVVAAGGTVLVFGHRVLRDAFVLVIVIAVQRVAVGAVDVVGVVAVLDGLVAAIGTVLVFGDCVLGMQVGGHSGFPSRLETHQVMRNGPYRIDVHIAIDA